MTAFAGATLRVVLLQTQRYVMASEPTEPDAAEQSDGTRTYRVPWSEVEALFAVHADGAAQNEPAPYSISRPPGATLAEMAADIARVERNADSRRWHETRCHREDCPVCGRQRRRRRAPDCMGDNPVGEGAEPPQS